MLSGIAIFERTHLQHRFNFPVLHWMLLVKLYVQEVLIPSISLFGQLKLENYSM